MTDVDEMIEDAARAHLEARCGYAMKPGRAALREAEASLSSLCIPLETLAALKEGEMVAAQGWQPIEMAPKDNFIDIWTSDGFRATNCTWVHERGAFYSGGLIVLNPTHYMPLPTKPE